MRIAHGASPADADRGAAPFAFPSRPEAPLIATSAEFVRHFGLWQERASEAPVFVTHHGRPRHAMISLAAYDALVAGGDRPAGSTDGAAARLEALLDQIDAAIVTVDGDQIVTSINPAAGSYFGIGSDALVGQPAHLHLPEFERSMIRTHIARAITAGEAAGFELPAISRPGEWLRCAVFPFADGAACMFRNVTPERMSRLADQTQAALASALAALGTVGHATLSLRGTLTRVSPPLARLAGVEPAALAHVRLTDLLPLARRVEAARQIEAVLNGEAERAFDTALLAGTGGERAITLALAPLRGDHGLDGATAVIVAR